MRSRRASTSIPPIRSPPSRCFRQRSDRMADVNGHAFRERRVGEPATLCPESRGREIVARIVNGAVERAMFGEKAEKGGGRAAWQPASQPAAGQPLPEWD